MTHFTNERTILILLALTSFILFLSANLVKPVLPVMAKELRGNELEISSVLMISIVLLSLTQPVTGTLADKYGYIKLIVLGSLVGALSSLACAYATSWKDLFILRALGGLADAISAPAILALVASISSRRRGLVFGVFRCSQGLSFVLGPIIGATIAKLISLRAPFIFDFILTVVAVATFITFLNIKNGKDVVNGKSEGTFLNFQVLKGIITNKEMLKAAYLGFSENFSFTIWISFLPVYVLTLGFREVEIGLIISSEALAFSLSNIFVGYASDRLGRKPVALLGAVVTTTSSLSYLLVSNIEHLIVSSILYGVGCSMIFLMSTVTATDIIPESQRGLMLGTFDALMDLGLAIGSIFNWLILKLTNLPLSTSFLIMAFATGLIIPVCLKIKERAR